MAAGRPRKAKEKAEAVSSIQLQPKQGIAFTTEATEVLFGGAAGGGKSLLMRSSAIRWCAEVPGIQIYFFRRTLPDLRDNHLRGPSSFFVLLQSWLAGGAVKYRAVENEFVFWNGSILHLCYCDSENDVEKYRGAEVHILCCEENEQALMADGSRRKIGSVRVGDEVMTLQGPRRVTWVGDRKLKPCVKAEVTVGDVTFEQVQSETHKVLTPEGWISYADMSGGFRPPSIFASTELNIERKSSEPSASGLRNGQPFHETPSSDSLRRDGFSELSQDRQSLLETSSCKAQQVQESDYEASENGRKVSEKSASGFLFPVVLHAPIRSQSEDEFLKESPLGEESYALSEYMREDSLFGYRPSSGLNGGHLYCHSDKPHDGAHKQDDAVQHSPTNLLLDERGTTPTHSLYGRCEYSHPYTGEERFSEEAVRLGTCFIFPCGERWTVDLTVEGENHYITGNGLVNQNCIDELTHFSEYQFRFLRSRVRIAGLEIPEKYKARLPRIEAASNPGSIGHAWVKRTFINPKPELEIWRAPPEEGGMLRQFIPSKLSDNPALLKGDPEYANRLRGLGSNSLVRAMLDGDWNIVAGSAFEKLARSTHAVEPFPIPDHWLKCRAMDWGSSKPFSVGWWAVVGEDTYINNDTGEVIPPDGNRAGCMKIRQGCLLLYREWYGWTGKADEGLRMEAADVARGIVERSVGERYAYTVADSSMWAVDGGPSIAETFLRNGVVMKKSTKNRHVGYVEVRGRIAGDEDGPMMMAFRTCHDGFWRTMPDLILDEAKYGLKAESVETSQEDHVSDMVMYMATSRPWVRVIDKKEEAKDDWLRFEENEETEDWRTA